MHLDRIILRNFRNFDNETVSLPPEGAALIGPNAQGKTNFLEAIYYLEIFRSFRGARDEQLIRFGSDHFRLEGRLTGDEGGGEVELAAGYLREVRRKKVTVNGDEVGRVAENMGRVAAVIFTSSDVEMIAGGPGSRRRYLDIILSLEEPGYLASLQRYRQILSQRNELLRRRGDESALTAWDEALVAEGARLTEARARWVAGAHALFAQAYERVSGDQTAVLAYSPSLGDAELDATPTADEWMSVFRSRLDSLRDRERRRGVTLVGPHRDDLHVGMLDGDRPIGLRSFGSAGQQRTAAIALRIVEAETLRAVRRRPPLIMLDDVFAELDRERSERLLEMLSQGEWGQVIMTSPRPDDHASLGGRLKPYRISAGKVSPA